MERPTSVSWLWSTLDISIALTATLVCLLLENAETSLSSIADVLALRITVKNTLLLTAFLVLWIGIHQLSGLHFSIRRHVARPITLRIFFASALGSVFFLLFPLFSNGQSFPVEAVLIFFTVALTASICLRSVICPFVPKLLKIDTAPVRMLIVGSGAMALRLYDSLLAVSKRTHVVLGFVDSPGPHAIPQKIQSALLGPLENLETILMSTAVDEVLIALPLRSSYDQIQTAIQVCESVGVPVVYHYQPFRHAFGFSQVEERMLQPYMTWQPSRIAEGDFGKRLFDLAGASAGLVLLAPVMALISIAIKFSSKGPVFFTQERYGLNKRRFRMYKFRTMVLDAEARQAELESKNEAQGPVFKIKRDPRVTPLGQWLRKTSLDELPQFFNVWKGDMSLVGPRPLPLRDVSKFSDAWLMRRFSVKPGLTCLWQVQGRSNTSFTEWIALDLKYIDTWSPLLDLKILALTIPAVLRGSGAM